MSTVTMSGDKVPSVTSGSIEKGALDIEEENAERLLTKKIDKHVIPIVMTLYLLSFLDRINIGNARLYGLEKDLGMTGQMFQTSISVLFITYLLFEIPSNLLLKKLRPSRYLPAITICWGIVATLTGLVQSYGGLIACRLLLGLFEAGLFPGMTVYLTFFYTRKELALRIGYLFVSAALAGACGGLLAYGLGHLDGRAGMRGWRWILIIEGIPTVFVGIASIWLLADDPESATYLEPHEKERLRRRKLQEEGATVDSQKFHWKDVRAAFLDWKVYGFAVAQFGVDTMLYGFSTFLPTIISQIGTWPTHVVQALTIPCYCVGAISYLTVAYISDRTQRRGVFCVAFGMVSIVGYAILLSPVSGGVHYLGCFMIACGLYVAVGIPLSWLSNNIPRYGKKTTASGFQLTIGNASGVMAPFIYATADKPRYIRGHAVSLAMVAMASIIYAVFWWWYDQANARRQAGEEDWKLEGKTEDEVREMGDESPNFVFMT